MRDRIEWKAGEIFPNTWHSVEPEFRASFSPKWSVSIQGTRWLNDEPTENVSFRVAHYGRTLTSRPTPVKAKALAELLDLVLDTVYV